MDAYNVNHQKVINDPSLTLATRLLAAKVMTQPMMLVGTYFKELSDAELDNYRELATVSGLDVDSSHDAGAELYLITLMLTSAEGTTAINIEELNNHIAFTKIFISTCALHREGLVTAYFDKFSYGSDMAHNVIAVPTEAGREFSKKMQEGEF